MELLLIGTLICTALLYINIVTTIKKIHKNEKIIFNNICGAILAIFIAYSFLIL